MARSAGLGAQSSGEVQGLALPPVSGRGALQL